MAPFLRDRGFTHIEEMRHGARARVGSLEVTSYQSGSDDSIVVIGDGRTTLLNMNDAKAAGAALGQILRRHPRPDFFLRSHSPAQAFPFCYTADDPADLALLPRSYYFDLFAGGARAIRPRFAVPFASNVCHLHPESRRHDADLITPAEVREACRDRVGEAEVVVMAPGDSWSAEEGFSLASAQAAPEDRAAEIERLWSANEAKITQAMQDERALPAVDFATFAGYVQRFARAVPWILRRAYPARVAWEMPDGFYVVDLRRGAVALRKEAPDDVHSVVRANPHMVKDAIDKGGLNLVGISRRISVHLRRGGTTCDAAFWGLLTLYELGYLPVRRVLNPRALGALAVRWREVLGYVPALLVPKSSLQRVIEAKTAR
jgi:UDP-MurNAc hydroxylase